VPLLLNASNDFNATSTRFLYKNDWARVKAISVGYNLDKEANEKLKTESIRIFIQGDNLFTFTNHDGIDPEQTLSGLTNSRSSLMRTVTLGLNIKL
jgi:argonaute-like protein implicated in RNA metabolism and viral defense